MGRIALLFCVTLVLASTVCLAAAPASAPAGAEAFPPDLHSYGDAGQGVFDRLQNRIRANPFNLAGTLIFFCAIVHTFLAAKFTAISHRLEHEHEKKIVKGQAPLNSISHRSQILHFLGEVEVVFGLWAIPLLVAIAWFFDWGTVVNYVSNRVNYTEAMFVVVIMTLAASRPILKLSEIAMARVAALLGGSLTAWWLTILTLGPLLGSFITEPAAMTICALLLIRKFYVLEPSTKFKYATLGLLFVNVSVGGTLTHFAAPPVLMVAAPWGWGIGHMITNFGWKAAAGIVVANLIYWFIFRGELLALREKFAVEEFEDQILTTHLPREALERALDAISAEVREELGDLKENVSAEVEKFSAEVEKRLEKQYMASIAKTDVDPDLAARAFHQRFEEVKLYRFQREFPHLLEKERRAPFKDPNWDHREDPVPWWIMAVHVVFMAWTIFNVHHPELFVVGILFFLGFAAVTSDYQNNIDLKPPLLVGFFLGGLVTHGGVQGWWIEPVLGSLTEFPLMVMSIGLTAFNDNAAITYLSTLVPEFTDGLKYAVVAGAVTGGGLTVIANAPNPAGQAILKGHFENGINPAGLFLGAVIPTIVLATFFLVFG